MRRLLALLTSLLGLALAPAAAQAFTFYEWDAAGGPAGITASAGTLYFTLGTTQKINTLTVGGVQGATPFTVPGATAPGKIVPGAAGTLWFLDGNAVGQLTL